MNSTYVLWIVALDVLTVALAWLLFRTFGATDEALVEAPGGGARGGRVHHRPAGAAGPALVHSSARPPGT